MSEVKKKNIGPALTPLRVAPLGTTPPFASSSKAVTVEHQAFLLRKAEAAAKEAPWRATLSLMDREELIELAISAAYNSEHLWKRIHRLRDRNVKNRRDRQKGARIKLGNSPIQQVKPEVKYLWQEHNACRDGYRYPSGAAFDRAMQKKFSVITDPGTVEGWRREWKKELVAESTIPDTEERPSISKPVEKKISCRWEPGSGIQRTILVAGLLQTVISRFASTPPFVLDEVDTPACTAMHPCPRHWTGARHASTSRLRIRSPSFHHRRPKGRSPYPGARADFQVNSLGRCQGWIVSAANSRPR